MGMTIIEKIFARKAGLKRVSAGETVVVDVDMTVLIDLQFATMWLNRFASMIPTSSRSSWTTPCPRRPSKTRPADRTPASSPPSSASTVSTTSADTASAIRSSPRMGWRVPEKFWPAPTLTPARPAPTTPPPADSVQPRCIRSCAPAAPGFRSRRPSAIELDGRQTRRVSGKDIFLHIANEYGDAANLNLEFGGPGLASFPMHDRRTIATQGAEISADFSTFEPDQVLVRRISKTAASPDTTLRHRIPMRSTARMRRVDLAAFEPYVARPGTVSRNGLPVSQIERQKIDQAFIGSCANGQLEDLEIAANILRGNTVATGVRLLVTPASQAVYREAMRLGYSAGHRRRRRGDHATRPAALASATTWGWSDRAKCV